jgi:hypothetical protein
VNDIVHSYCYLEESSDCWRALESLPRRRSVADRDRFDADLTFVLSKRGRSSLRSRYVSSFTIRDDSGRLFARLIGVTPISARSGTWADYMGIPI